MRSENRSCPDPIRRQRLDLSMTEERRWLISKSGRSPTSTQCQKISNAEIFRASEMLEHGRSLGAIARDVKHRVDTAVVQHRVGNHHGACLFVASRVTGGMPCDVTEEWLTNGHTIETSLGNGMERELGEEKNKITMR